MASSRIPAAIDALHALAAAALTEVDVNNGPALTSDYADKLSVGYAGIENSEVVSFDQEQAGHARGAHPRKEVFFISNVINAGSGDDDMSARRNRAFEILAELEAALRLNPSMGIPGLTAQIADGSLLQDRGEKGMFAALLFRVRCKSHI